MAADTLTLALNGRVSLADFASATVKLQRLVVGLAKQITPGATVEWEIADLQEGSAITTIRGETAKLDALDAIVTGYEFVGECLRNAKVIPYGPAVAKPANGIAALLNGHITSLRFETANKDVTIASNSTKLKSPTTTLAYGMVEGRVQTLTSRAGLRFTLYDKTFDAAVACYCLLYTSDAADE